MRCAACGTENRAGSRFCDNCGSPMASPCPSCGAENRADARFCATCGHAFTSANATAAPVAAATASAGAPTAERRLVSVLFTDLVGFTTLAEDRDPEAVRELLNKYFETATQVVERHGGTVEKFIGDAVMAVWGTPVAHEDDAERAVRAALEVVDAVRGLQPDLQARSGVLTGEAAVTLNAQNQGMVAGDLVNTAARLQGVAEAGTVLVGEATMRAAERSIVFEPIGDHALKGKTTPVPAWRAVRVVAQRGGHGRADTLEAPFVGREEELRQLKEVLHAVGRERRPRLVSITGPGGIGKSRLVWELEKYIDGVAEDVYWHRGRSPSYGEGITFWALGEMVRRRAQLTEDADEAATRAAVDAMLIEYVADEAERVRIGPALRALLGVEEGPEGGRDVLFPAWRSLFEHVAQRGTTVLAFEDLQWADAGLLDFIDHLLDWSRGLPIMVVTLARPELFDRRPDWGANRRQLTAVALDPLTDAAMSELLNGLVPGLPEDALAAIVGRAEGMPLYAVETVRGLLADGLIERRGDVYEPTGDLSAIRVPDSLRALIASRLDGLDPADRALLQDAAVLGQVFGVDALAAVSGADQGELGPRLAGLVRRELLDVERDPASPERGQHKFVQSLIREVAYGTLARRDRRARHLAVARHYEGIGDDELAGALAGHYLAAREASDEGAEADAVAAQARLALVGAADRAASLGGHDQALTFLEQALTVAAEPIDRAPILDRAAESAAAASREAERYGSAAIAAYLAVDDPVAAAAATARLGKVLIDNGQLLRARDVLDLAVPEAEALGDDPVLAETLEHAARVHMRLGEGEVAAALADRGLAIAERLNLERIVVEGFVNRGSALSMLGRRREAIALQEAALELVIRLGDRNLEMRVRNNLASAYQDDEPVKALRMLEEARDLAREVGDRGMYNWLTATAGISAMFEGRDWDEHISLMREAYESATLSADRARIRVLLGALEAERGEHLDELERDMKAIVGDSDNTDERFSLHMALSNAAAARRDYEGAWRNAMVVADMQSQNPEVGLDQALEIAIALRDIDRVREIQRRRANLPGSGAFSRVGIMTASGAEAALSGRRQEALETFRELRALVASIEQRYDLAVRTLFAVQLMPEEPEVRGWADEARQTMTDLKAARRLRELEEALADAPSLVDESVTGTEVTTTG